MEEIAGSHNWSQSVIITLEAVIAGSNQLCSHQPQLQHQQQAQLVAANHLQLQSQLVAAKLAAIIRDRI